MPMRGNNQRGFASENIKLDSACALFSDEHRITHELAEVFEEIESLLTERDPGCEVTIGAAGCGGCVNESADYSVFYIAQDRGLDTHLMLKYDTGGDEDDREPALTRTELGEVICEAATRQRVDWSWNGKTSKCVCVGKDDAYEDPIDVDPNGE